MNRITRFAALAIAVAFAVGTQPALAVVGYIPPKLVKQGSSGVAIAGTGVVIVQVQVNADGTHKAIRVIRSSNSGDNSAAMDIARNSSYRVGTRNRKPVTAYYDFTLKFKGKSVGVQQGSESNSPTASIDRMLRAGNYSGAKNAATQYLLTAPADDTARQQLGTADFFLSNNQAAAEAFSHVSSIQKKYQLVAAHAFASAAVEIQQSNPTQSLAYAQKAMALDNSANSAFALGVAELANNQASAAIANLQRARTAQFADKKTSVKTKVVIDSQLMQAYTAAGDAQQAQAMAAEIKRLDPNSPVLGQMVGSQMLSAGIAASKAGKHDEAIKDFEQAAGAGNAAIAVTALTDAAFEVARSDKPDYTKMKTYADRALALQPNNPETNYAEGVALAGIWATSKHDDASKKAAMDALNKADSLAKAAGNTTLALTIESFIKNTIK
jgi:tetratricopeptide (TPR) repeat protein